MKCPKCSTDLVPAIRHKIQVNTCPTCKGMWFDAQELNQLEDEAFDFGDDAKGTVVFRSTPTTDKCPQCSSALSCFQYRFYDLAMEFCGNQHGYWLTAEEDDRVLELMKQEEKDYERKMLAEDQWSRTLKHMRSGSFFSKVKNLFR